MSFKINKKAFNDSILKLKRPNKVGEKDLVLFMPFSKKILKMSQKILLGQRIKHFQKIVQMTTQLTKGKVGVLRKSFYKIGNFYSSPREGSKVKRAKQFTIYKLYKT